MTRLHYPREFRQQSPAVLVEKTKGVNTKRRLDSITLPLINPKMQPDWRTGPGSASRSRPFRIQAMGESTIYTLLAS